MSALGNIFKLGRIIHADAYFGITGDGVTDDRAGMLNALFEVAERGGVLVIPPNFNIALSAALTLTGFSGTKRPFAIVGHGQSSVLSRLNGCGTVVNLRTCPEGVVVRDLRLEVHASTRPTNANLGIVIGGSSHALVQNVVVNDPRAGGVAIFSESGSGEGPIEGCLIDNVKVYGNASGSNIGVDVAILIAGQQVSRSGITNCQVYGGGRDVALSPGIGIELKFSGPGCWIDNCYAEDYIQGFGFAGSAIDGYCYDARISNVYAKNCSVGFNGGWLENSTVSGLVIDMANQTSGVFEPIQISRSGNVYKGVIIKNAGMTTKYHARFIGDAANNVVDIDLIDNANSASYVASFESTTANNRVTVRRMANPTVSVLTAANVIQDNTSGKTNTVDIDGLPVVVERTIASGAVTCDKRADHNIILDTEGGAASDDLDTISGARAGQIVRLRTTANARDVVVKHGTGNIELVGAADFTLDMANSCLLLMYHANTSKWCEIARADL